MNKFLFFLEKFNKILGYVCGSFAILMVINVLLVVILRYIFSISFIWMQETYVWLHASIFMIGSGYAYLTNDHVRIDVFYRTKSDKYRAWVDLLGNIFLLLPFLYIIWKFSYPFVERSWKINEVSREVGGLPMLYLLKTTILIFVISLLLQSIASIIKSTKTLFSNS